MEPTETSSSTETKLERIAWLSAVDPGKVFNQVIWQPFSRQIFN
ncbi:hypothetical protein [Piscirickettsia salmonis]|uniref:Uncharacterized protein n=1 Tax=Piscirickettsia salmonis TaxID=1238 RepID=A0A9Q6LH40_PISSA|nr:hypothetical protein [Piscirickettsia salmonis]QGN79094.1 hypothetical protein Psal001_03356 [Piscirickettsia salmonis]QGN82678.1 hypothetical protein Psal002_03375 [Piscirickettsia salmonis]QGN93339.1 hypothetical protein Psal005_03429 [Piscirickettsia salmonis]QGN96761.1 hypothetical protein Psal006a_03414 [Piscirickettsia salmonis]QGO04457.1 hypothetical protein Psal009_00324 [Piscirickettsia salmonis]